MDVIIFMLFCFFGPFRDVYLHTSTPNFIVTKFPFVIFQVLNQSHSPQTINWYIIAHLANSSHKQNEQPEGSLEVLATRRFSFTDVPDKGCSATAVHFQAVPACLTEPSVNQS